MHYGNLIHLYGILSNKLNFLRIKLYEWQIWKCQINFAHRHDFNTSLSLKEINHFNKTKCCRAGRLEHVAISHKFKDSNPPLTLLSWEFPATSSLLSISSLPPSLLPSKHTLKVIILCVGIICFCA